MQHINTLKTFACNLNLTCCLWPQKKILDKIFGYNFTLKKPAVYDHRKDTGQDFSLSTSGIWKEKDAIFLNKILWKITGKAALDNLNCKIFFVSQPWWLTGIFRYIPTDRPELEMTTKKWHYLIRMTAGIKNVISSTVVVTQQVKYEILKG